MPIPLLRAALVAAAFLPALAPADPLSLDQALRLAVQRSEAARASRAASDGAHAAAQAAGQQPDPTLHVGVDNLPVTGADRFSTARDSMTMKRIGVSQEWLSADKRAAREASALAVGDRDTVLASAAEADARLQTALAFLDAWFADATLKLSTEAEHHLHEEFDAARARLAAGAIGSPEILQLRASQGLAEDDSEEARQQQAAALLALQRWTGIKPDALVPPPAWIVPTEDDYLARAPVLSVLQREVGVARTAATVTAQDRHPSWTWEVSYGQRAGYSDMVSVGVSIPLPIAPGQRQDRDLASKLARVDQAEADLAEAQRAARLEYQTLRSDAERLQQRLDRYQTAVVMPSRQRTEAALSAYRSNQVPLAMVFEARHMELDAQRRLLQLQRELAKVQAQLVFKPIAAGAFQ